uniref:Uncharacterized protein n=1 Tax=Rhizophora mucronata TaxID=61149 RepID=A0A2P2PVZ9_RHIMU
MSPYRKENVIRFLSWIPFIVFNICKDLHALVSNSLSYPRFNINVLYLKPMPLTPKSLLIFSICIKFIVYNL